MKNIVIVMNIGSLPVPAVKGGAIENLVQNLLDGNEKEPVAMFHVIMAKAKSDNTNYTYNYKYARFYNYYYNEKFAVCIRTVNAINKRMSYVLPLYSGFDNFVLGVVKDVRPDAVVYEGAFSANVKRLKRVVGRENMCYHIHHRVKLKLDLSKWFGRVLCVSEYIKNDWLKSKKMKNPIEFKVVRNVVDVEKFNKEFSEEERVKLRQSLGFSKDDFVCIYSGRLIEIKGVLELVCAIKNIDNPHVKLMLCGSSDFKGGKNTKYIEKLKDVVDGIRDKVVFTGFVPYENMYKYLKISDLQIMPSTCEEAAPLTLIEGGLVGLNQIATNSGGAPEYVVDPRKVTIVEKENNLIEKLTTQILHYYNNATKSSGLQKIKYQTLQNYAKDFVEKVCE